MGPFLAFIGFVGLIVFIVIAIVSAIKKNGKGKKRMLYALGCLVIMIIGGAITPTSKETAASPAENNSSAKANDSTKQRAADIAKKKEQEQQKATEEAKKKADEEAAAKKKADEEARNPQWNVKDTNFDTNGNGPLALNLLKVMGDISQKGVAVDAGTVFKAPWNYYGKPTKLSGSVVIVQDYPPGSDEVNAGLQSQIVFMAEDTTPIIVFSTVPSGKLKVGDDFTVVGYPVGLTTVDNKLGGQTQELVIITNKVQ